jgi:4a-hydroxytetrahydrobiopterin dehydratase
MRDMTGAIQPLSRADASAAVTGLGWRYVLGVARTTVPVRSLHEAADVAARVLAQCGAVADGHLLLDLRNDGLILTLRNLQAGSVTAAEAGLARRISEFVAGLGLRTDAFGGPARSVQLLELAIDALDIASIRPFWRAVLGYGDEPGQAGPLDQIVDPAGQSPPIWFQQMTESRPQRNRIHLDISVPHDEAPGRIEAAIGAGGVLVSDSRAPAFWVLADAEGNEACVTTWQGRS